MLIGVGDQSHAPAPLSPENISVTQSTGGWVWSRNGLNGDVEQKISYHRRGSNPGTSRL